MNLFAFKRKDGGRDISYYVKHSKLETKKALKNFPAQSILSFGGARDVFICVSKC